MLKEWGVEYIRRLRIAQQYEEEYRWREMYTNCPPKMTELFTTTIIFTSRIISCSKHRQNSLLRTEKTLIIFDSLWLLQTSPSERTFFAQAIFWEKSPIVKHYHRLIYSITWWGVVSCCCLRYYFSSTVSQPIQNPHFKYNIVLQYKYGKYQMTKEEKQK